MEVKINKTELVLETSGNTTLNVTESSTPLSQTSFEGLTGFNTNYVSPLFELFASKQPFFKCITIKGDLDKSGKKESVVMFNIANLRQTSFLFSTLKTLGVSLNQLNLGILESDTEHVLYIHPRIVYLLRSLNDESKAQLVMYLYSLAKFFYAVTKADALIILSESKVPTTSQNTLKEIYDSYGTFKESFIVDCRILNDDVCFDSVIYNVLNVSKPAKSNMVIPSKCEYVYNVISDASGDSLIIVNKTFKPMIYYRIINNVIYTNNTLSAYNTFDFAEWMPSLICDLISINPTNQIVYPIVHLDTERLLTSKSEEVHINADLSCSDVFLNLMEMHPNIVENYDLKIYESYFKTSKIISGMSVNSLVDQYKDDTYAQELYKQVKPYYDSFDLKDLTGIVKGVAKGDVYSMMFEGEAGTGKSTAARVIAHKCGLPFIAINCSTNIEEADIVGSMIPNTKKLTANDPEFVWQDGPLTKAVRNGYVCIIEELGGARPGVLMKLNSLLDESKQLDLPNGEIIKAHPNFRIVTTTNIAYDGTNRLNKALVDRFDICKKFEDLDQREATLVIKSRTGYTDDSKISDIFNVYNAIKKYSNEQKLGLAISIRRLLAIFTIGKYYKNAEDAINSLLLNQAFLEEPEHLKYFKDTVLSAFKLTFKL